MTENEIGKIVLDAAITIHKALGSGVYEIVYEIVLTHELKKHGLNVERQVPVSIEYDGIKFDEGWNFKNCKRKTQTKPIFLLSTRRLCVRISNLRAVLDEF